MAVFQCINAKCGFIKVRFSLKAQIMCPVFQIFQQLAADKATLFGLVYRSFHRAEPLLAQILGFKSAPRVHKESAHARVLHRTDLPPQLVRL